MLVLGDGHDMYLILTHEYDLLDQTVVQTDRGVVPTASMTTSRLGQRSVPWSVVEWPREIVRNMIQWTTNPEIKLFQMSRQTTASR